MLKYKDLTVLIPATKHSRQDITIAVIGYCGVVEIIKTVRAAWIYTFGKPGISYMHTSLYVTKAIIKTYWKTTPFAHRSVKEKYQWLARYNKEQNNETETEGS